MLATVLASLPYKFLIEFQPLFSSLLQNYIVSHIDQQQALVIVEHSSSQFNLYLSDLTGVYYALSLPDIVTDDFIVDLEVVSVQ